MYPGGLLLFARESFLIEKQIVETAQEARGAERGPSVRNVLIVSTIGVVVAFVVIYILFVVPRV